MKLTKNQKMYVGIAVGIVGVLALVSYAKQMQSKKKVEAAKQASLAAAKAAPAAGTGFDSMPNMTVMQAGQQAAEDWRMKAV